MNCKNCQDDLRTDYQYCPGCGAKVVNHRITFKWLFADALERFLNIDNSIYRTIIQMTIRPGRVISEYMEGTRRKYLSPMNYIAVALALSGVVFYLLRKFALQKIDFDVFNTGVRSEASQKIMNTVLEYSSFVFILYVPILAISGYLTINKKEYNLPEYLVSATYVLAHTSILVFLPTTLMIMLAPEKYVGFSLFMLPFMAFFSLYAFLNTHRYTGGIAIVRAFAFLTLYMIGYMMLSMGISFIMVLFGELNLADFRPVKTA